jgi:nucleoside-diphosphate-sugar epimerase
MMKMLITGSISGLGRYLHENLGGLGLARANFKNDIREIKGKGVDVIVHCAFNPAKDVDAQSLYSYLYDNVLITKELTALAHKKFIYISSIDVYPKNNTLHSEDEHIDVSSISTIYGLTKLMSESIIINNCRSYLILRPAALLGKYSRKNSLVRILDEKNCRLTLSSRSRLNYVLHSDVLNFIKFAIDKGLKGVHNVAASKNITLAQVANMAGNRVKFGKYYYDAGNINNSKIVSIFPDFNKTSLEVIREFIGTRK